MSRVTHPHGNVELYIAVIYIPKQVPKRSKAMPTMLILVELTDTEATPPLLELTDTEATPPFLGLIDNKATPPHCPDRQLGHTFFTFSLI